ncbi:MAG: hypothetical protein KIB45_06120 [Negativicoccus succinicivorans]|uniref:hypothetical protein n=1 Tax=Negativicoccus succinicivorans TaxID=620903 RepID=UPI0023555B43|nr:hypothetical protein [Negativicoccus succinicivorans]MBS5890640.1 hypothetical protein [Negativicoccus succinicivorans]
MIEIKITGESAFDVVAEMQGLLCGAWLTDKDASMSAREAVAIDTAVKAAANGAEVKSVPAPMKQEAEKPVEKVVEKAATAEDVRSAFGAAMDRVGKDKVQALLEEYAPKLSQVKPENYAALIERAEALA